MPSTRWKPVPAPVVEAARQARARGLSLRAISIELANGDMLSPSGRPYLPGSIAAMVRDHDYLGAMLPTEPVDDLEIELDADGDAAPPADAVNITQALDEPLTECSAQPVDAVPTLQPVDAELEQPAAPIVDAVPTLQPVDDLPAVDAELEQPAAPIVDAVAFDAAHGLPAADVDAAPLHALEPQPAPPAVDKPRWEARRGRGGVIDFHSLMKRLSEIPESMQAAAMASAGLRVDQMVDLIDNPSPRDCIANWLHWHS